MKLRSVTTPVILKLMMTGSLPASTQMKNPVQRQRTGRKADVFKERKYGSGLTEADERTMYRDHTKEIQIGSRVIGGGNPIAVQSMTNTRTENAAATIAQILQLEEAGCEIIRSTVPTMEAAEAFRTIKNAIHIPIVADIHFDYRLAIAAMENGADAIRINPGNIGSPDRIKAVVDCAKERNIPIRVGVNSGSLEKEIVEKYGRVTAEGLHEIIAQKTDYPLHVGITEAGTVFSGTVKSSVGLGMILGQGIGDTIRVSLTGDPIEEVRVGKRILQTLGLRRGYIEVVSCPTCGRTQIDLISLANSVEKMVEGIPLDLKVAVMGCVVNGPGEAREADLAVCGGVGTGLIMRRGEIIRKVPESELLSALREELENWKSN